MNETSQRRFGLGWPSVLTVTCLLGVLIYGSGHDWKSANFLFWAYLPMYAVLWWLCYTLLGFALGLAGRSLKIRSPWMPWVIIPAVGVIPRAQQAAWAILHWKYYSYSLIPLSIGFASFLAFAFLGYALSRRIGLSSRTTAFAIVAIAVALLLTESATVVNYISTRGTYLRYRTQWDDWQQGQSLPSNWETAEVSGIRFILRDHFIGHNKCHGYFHVPEGAVAPKEGPWGQIRDSRRMPGEWYEFLSN